MQQPSRQPGDGNAEDAHRDQSEGGVRVDAGRYDAGIDAALQVLDEPLPGSANEGEALVLPGNARNRSIEEDEREVLRMVTAELVQLPKHGSDAFERRLRVVLRFFLGGDIAEQAQPFFRERK